jgi:putative ABC transport system permease protein
MKYFPLVWAALRRKPVRSMVTFLSVTVAFTLFGLMIGLSATMALMEQRSRADRIWTLGRFDNRAMPMAVARKIASVPGIKSVTVMSYLIGYVGDPKNGAGILMGDDAYGRIFPDQGPTPQEWDMVRHDRTAIVMSRARAAQFHKKAGDTFTLIAPQAVRADGSTTWTFRIAHVSEDVAQVPGGMMVGNYDYYDKSMPRAEQGKIAEVDSVAADPAQAPALAEKIDRLFANSASPTRTNTEKQLYAVSNNYGGMDVNALTREIALAGLLMIFFLTANVIAQSVRERRAEFATLKTFGFSDAIVIALVAVEAALPCLAGAVCGVAVAAGLAGQLPALMPPNYGLPTPVMSPAVFLWALASACVMALASTVLPALRLSRLDVASAVSGRA